MLEVVQGANMTLREVLQMDMISFGNLLTKVLRNRQREILVNAQAIRLAYHAGSDDFERWVKGVERSLEPGKVEARDAMRLFQRFGQE